MVVQLFCQYETHLYHGKKRETEYNFSEGVVLNLLQSLKDTYCTLYFNYFFNSPTLIAKLLDDGIYGISTVQLNCKMMPTLPDNKSMKQGDIHCQYSKKVICVKWKVNRNIVLLRSNSDGVYDCSSLQRHKGMSSKTSFHTPGL